MMSSDFVGKAQTAKTAIRAMIALGCGIVGSAALGKTVALWPLEWDAATGKPDLRCAINAENNLKYETTKTVDAATICSKTGWTQPANPDASEGMLFSPVNDTAIGHSSQSPDNFIWSDVCGKYVTPTNDFTVEGWVRFWQLPASTTFFCVVSGFKTDPWRWTLSLRRDVNVPGYTWQIFQNGGASDTAFTSVRDVAGLTQRWQHWALSHTWKNASGKTEWKLYLDGVYAGSVTQNAAQSATVPNYGLSFGTRCGSGGTMIGAVDYCRLSDCVLEPKDLLCFNSAALKATTSTVAYWKLGRTASGGVDGRDSVGLAALSDTPAQSKTTTTSMELSEDCAFTGNPPNPHAALPNGSNQGSLLAYGDRDGRLRFEGMGAQLDATNSFTVEGWLKPRRSNAEARDIQFICNTRGMGSGWALEFMHRTSPTNAALKAWGFELYVLGQEGILIPDGHIVGPDLTNWDDWRHVALVHDAEGAEGVGTWSIYLDGEPISVQTNSVRPTSSFNATPLELGGRHWSVEGEGVNRHFCGGYDCWRVCRAALAPNQFLCATNNPAPATNVLAYWPFNVANGAYWDAADIAANQTFLAVRDGKYRAAATSDAPAISNPDRSANFRGNSSELNGSVGFRGFGGSNCMLGTMNETVLNTLSSTNGWTFETYLNLAQTPSSTSWDVIFLTASGYSFATGSSHLNFSYRAKGFVMYDFAYTSDAAGTQAAMFDVPFNAAISVGGWHHVALTCEPSSSNVVYKLYVDGEKKGDTLSSTMVCKVPKKADALLVGGRPWSAQGFSGHMSSVRLSNRVLDPSEFLCAPGPSAETAAPRTIACWPLDWNGTKLDMANRLGGTYFDLSVGTNGAATGVSAAAIARIPQPDDSEDFPVYVGDRKQNVGSIALANRANYYSYELANNLDLGQAFTAEGWMKWADANNGADETVVGTFRSTDSFRAGWKLLVKPTGMGRAKLGLVAKPEEPRSVIADFASAGEISADTWYHVAVTYDPSVGNGVWTLLLDGEEFARAENIYAPAGGRFVQRFFILGLMERDPDGSMSFTGGLDFWRVSQGVRTKADILYSRPRGTIFVVR